MRLNPHPELMPIIPRVRPVKWWLWRLAMVAVLVFLFAAAMVPWPSCQPVPFLSHVPGVGSHTERVCTPPTWQWDLRIEIALTGVVIALLLVGLGSLLDRRHRRGAALG